MAFLQLLDRQAFVKQRCHARDNCRKCVRVAQREQKGQNQGKNWGVQESSPMQSEQPQKADPHTDPVRVSRLPVVVRVFGSLPSLNRLKGDLPTSFTSFFVIRSPNLVIHFPCALPPSQWPLALKHSTAPEIGIA